MAEGLKLRQRKGRRSTVREMTLPGALDQAIPPDPIADLGRKPSREMQRRSDLGIRPKPNATHGKTWSL